MENHHFYMFLLGKSTINGNFPVRNLLVSQRVTTTNHMLPSCLAHASTNAVTACMAISAARQRRAKSTSAWQRGNALGAASRAS